MITFFGFAKTVEAGAGLKNHGYRGSMSSYYYPPLNNIIIHKIIFVHHYTIKIVHSYFDIYTYGKILRFNYKAHLIN